MAVDAYEMLQKRLNAVGGNQEGRMKRQKQKSLGKALLYSEQAETIIREGVVHRAILNKNKQKMDYDDKNISAPFDVGFKVGDIFHWVEDSSDWIIYLKEGQDAYFTGICRKALYDVRWKDEFGVYYSCKASVRGPVETRIKSESKSKVSYDIPNYSLYILMPNNEETSKLKRYSKVAIKGIVWLVEVVDSISEPGILEIQLIEDYINKQEDQDLVKPGDGTCEFIPSENTVIKTSLDGIDTIEINEPFKLRASVEISGDVNEELTKSAKFSLVGSGASIMEGLLTGLVVGDVSIEMEIPKLCYKKTFLIHITDAVLPSFAKYEILGDSKVKSFGDNEYRMAYHLDGIDTTFDRVGEWTYIPNKSLFTIQSSSVDSIIIKWKTGSHGELNLTYTENGVLIAEKKIKVESLI